MGDQFLALSYAISRYVEGKGPDKTFKELDEETQEFFRGLQPALFEINRRYTAHMWEKMDLLEKKWAKQGKSKDEIVIKLKKILPDQGILLLIRLHLYQYQLIQPQLALRQTMELNQIE